MTREFTFPVPEGYPEFHQKVVDACVVLMSETHRDFFNGCDYLEEFSANKTPGEVADGQLESIDFCY